MQFAVFLPNFGPFGDTDALVELARDAEANGLERVLHLGPHPARRRRHRADRRPLGRADGRRRRDHEPADRDDDHPAGAAPALEGRSRDGHPRPCLQGPADPRRRPRLPARGRVRDLRRGDRRPRPGRQARRGARDPRRPLERREARLPGGALPGLRRPVPAPARSRSRGSRSGAAAGGRTNDRSGAPRAGTASPPSSPRRGAADPRRRSREIAAYVKEHGASDPFDIAINGYSDPGSGLEVGSIAYYEAAGLTWWLERIDTDRLFSFDQTQQRVHAGPPQRP